MGWCLVEAVFSHLGKLLLGLGEGVFDPTSFVPEPSPSGRAVPIMQMHYQESRGSPGAEVDKEQVLHLWLLICPV